MANTGDNYGAVLEALNEKMDRDVQNRGSGVETVVEHWHEGTEWYRVWSDGWIEQGGKIGRSTSNVSFNKSFSSNPLTIEITIYSTAGNSSDWYGVKTFNTTSMTVQSFSDHDRLWYACGY